MAVEHDVVIGDLGQIARHVDAGDLAKLPGRHQHLVGAEHALGDLAAHQHAVLRADHEICGRQAQPQRARTDADRLQPGIGLKIGGGQGPLSGPADRLQAVVAGPDQIAGGQILDSTGAAIGLDHRARGKAGHVRVLDRQIGRAHCRATALDGQRQAGQAIGAIEHVQHAVIGLIGAQPGQRRRIGLVRIGGVPPRKVLGAVIARQVDKIVVRRIAVADAACIAGVEIGDQIARAGDEGVVARAASQRIGFGAAIQKVVIVPARE